MLKDKDEKCQETIKLMNLRISALQERKSTDNPIFLNDMETNLTNALSRIAHLETEMESQRRYTESVTTQLHQVIKTQQNDMQTLRSRLDEHIISSKDEKNRFRERQDLMASDTVSLKADMASSQAALQALRVQVDAVSAQAEKALTDSIEYSAGFGDAALHFLGSADGLDQLQTMCDHSTPTNGEDTHINASTCPAKSPPPPPAEVSKSGSASTDCCDIACPVEAAPSPLAGMDMGGRPLPVLRRGMSVDYEKGYGAAIMRMVSSGMSVTIPGVGSSAPISDNDEEEEEEEEGEDRGGGDGEGAAVVSSTPTEVPQRQDTTYTQSLQTDSERLEKLLLDLHERLDAVQREVQQNHVDTQENIRIMKQKWNKKYVSMSETVKKSRDGKFSADGALEEDRAQSCTLTIYQCAKCYRESLGMEGLRTAHCRGGQSRSVVELPTIQQRKVSPSYRLETSTSVEEGVWWNMSR